MKKLLLVFAVCAAMTAGAQKAGQPKDSIPQAPKENVYTLRFNDAQLNVLYAAIDKSDFSHLQIEALKKFIGEQLKPQVKQSAK